jgi:hypothetical protein
VTTEDLIVNLARRAGWTPLPPIHVRVARWLAVSLALCALAVLLIGAREDLPSAMRDPAFILFAAATFAAGLVAAAAGMTLSVPGAEVTPVWRLLAVVLAAGWALAWTMALLSGGDAGLRLAAFPNHWPCVAEITGMSVLSGLVFFGMLRRAAPVRRTWCAALATLASATLAATATQIICPIDDPAHHLTGHVLPVSLLTAAGTLAGARALRALQ